MTDRLRIIIVTPEAPDPFGNAAARWYFVLAKGLVLGGHSVECLSAYSLIPTSESLNRAKESFASIGVRLHLYPYPRHSWLYRKWRTITKPYSFFLSEEIRKALEGFLRKGYDALNLEQTWTGYLNVGVPRTLLSVHHLETLDLDGVFQASPRFLLSKALMQTAEARLISMARNIRVTTERLRKEVARLNPNARVFLAPIAIDPDLYRFQEPPSRSKTVGLIASFGWYPGLNAGVRLITRVWPIVKKAVPGARLLVVGWGAKQALGHYVRDGDVTIATDVPDTKQYFHQLSAMAYPLEKGSGMKVKLLEAMAYGTPIVTTSEGAEGLRLRDGEHGLVADDDEGFASAVIRVLTEPQLSRQFSNAARVLVEESYSPTAVVPIMESIYRSMGTPEQRVSL